jgi:hypothetical protein
MVGLVPAIHVFVSEKRKTWMPASLYAKASPGVNIARPPKL